MKIFLQICFVTFIGLTCSSTVFSQILRGKVQCKEKSDIRLLPYANIVLFQEKDTTHFLKGIVCDEKGNFVIEDLELNKSYTIRASYTGFKAEDAYIPNVSSNMQLTFTLKPDNQLLSEVTVLGNLSYYDGEKKIELFSDKQIKSSQNGLDLVSQMPQLYLDPMQQKLQDRSGSSLTILINGIAASSEEIRNIPPDKILRVEYYDIPPLRFGFTGKLIDIITKRLDVGYNGGFGLQHAVATGFANDNLYFSHTWGNHQISLNYDCHWRNYKHNEQTSEYDFKLSGNRYLYSMQQKGKFNYVENDINVRYTFNRPDRFIFQIKFMPSYRPDNNKSDMDYLILTDNMPEVERQGTRRSHSSIFNPAINTYGNIKIKSDKQLYIDLLGNIFRTKQDYSNKQFEDKELVFDNFLNASTHRKSLIGQIIYQQDLKHNQQIYIGFNTSISQSDADIQNVLNNNVPYNYIINSNRYGFSAQYSRAFNKLFLTFAGLGTWYVSKNSLHKYREFFFSPVLIANYNINEKHRFYASLRMFSPTFPSISMMTEQATLTMENIISYGNPNIEASKRMSIDANYSFNNKYFSFSIYPFLTKTVDEIARYYSEEIFDNEPVMAEQWENADYYITTGHTTNLSIYPLGNRNLSLSVNYNYTHSIYKSKHMDKFHHNYHGIFLTAAYRTSKFGINAAYRIPGKYYRPLYISKEENNSELSMFYNIKKWRLSASWMFLFSPSTYSSETQPGSPMFRKWTSRIKDNQNMITLGVSFFFNKGRNVNVKKMIDNQDKDSGIL